ncbi:hypothetical protein LINPERPRIM_LOCUS15036 [Linum perenne]
MQGKSCKYK